MNEWMDERTNALQNNNLFFCLCLLSPTDKNTQISRVSSEEISAVSQTVLMFATIPKSVDRSQTFLIKFSPSDRSCPPHSFSSSKLLLYANNHLSVSICFSPQRNISDKDSSIISNSNIKYLPSCPWQTKLGRASPTSIQRTTDYTNTISEPLYWKLITKSKPFQRISHNAVQLDQNHSNSSHICLSEQLCFVFTQFFFPRRVLTRQRIALSFKSNSREQRGSFSENHNISI